MQGSTHQLFSFPTLHTELWPGYQNHVLLLAVSAAGSKVKVKTVRFGCGENPGCHFFTTRGATGNRLSVYFPPRHTSTIMFFCCQGGTIT